MNQNTSNTIPKNYRKVLPACNLVKEAQKSVIATGGFSVYHHHEADCPGIKDSHDCNCKIRVFIKEWLH